MKKYKLLKDLPCAGAGEIFQQGYDENDEDNIYLFQEILGAKQIKIWLDYIDDFDEWFEEVEEPEQYFSINIFKATVEEIKNIHYSEWAIENMKSIGMLFKSRNQAKAYLEYLKAKAIIKQDTKGFKPNWSNGYSYVHFGCWNNRRNELYADSTTSNEKYITIYFKTKKDLLESFKKHPEEWRVYLTYEQ